MHLILIAVKILAVWFAVSVPVAILTGKALKKLGKDPGQ